MKKFLVGFILPLFIFLLSGYNQLYAHTFRDYIHYSSTKILKKSIEANADELQNSQLLFIERAPLGSEKENFKIDATEIRENEEEEHESISPYNMPLWHSNFATIFYALTLGYLFFYIKKHILLRKYLYYISSYKWYLIFEVFRI